MDAVVRPVRELLALVLLTGIAVALASRWRVDHAPGGGA